MVSLGYTYLGENGIPRRHFFVRHNCCHLHLFELDGPDWNRHLRFRDRLLSDTALAASYIKTKLAAVAQCRGSREQYQALKAPFIQEFEQF